MLQAALQEEYQVAQLADGQWAIIMTYRVLPSSGVNDKLLLDV
jgi:hypothetical protein